MRIFYYMTQDRDFGRRSLRVSRPPSKQMLFRRTSRSDHSSSVLPPTHLGWCSLCSRLHWWSTSLLRFLKNMTCKRWSLKRSLGTTPSKNSRLKLAHHLLSSHQIVFLTMMLWTKIACSEGSKREDSSLLQLKRIHPPLYWIFRDPPTAKPTLFLGLIIISREDHLPKKWLSLSSKRALHGVLSLPMWITRLTAVTVWHTHNWLHHPIRST